MQQYPLELTSPPTYRREDFIESGCNREALAWIERWPDWPQRCLVVHGPTGCGKTHLAHIWSRRAEAAALLPAQIGALPSEALLKGRAAWLKEADRIADEVAWFHLLEALRQKEGFALLTARTAPAQWNVALPDLRSRLLAMPACAIEAPDDALLKVVMRKQFSDRQVTVGEEVLEYALARMERSFTAAQQLVERLDRAALSQKKAISLKLARKVLEENSELP